MFAIATETVIGKYPNPVSIGQKLKFQSLGFLI